MDRPDLNPPRPNTVRIPVFQGGHEFVACTLEDAVAAGTRLAQSLLHAAHLASTHRPPANAIAQPLIADAAALLALTYYAARITPDVRWHADGIVHVHFGLAREAMWADRRMLDVALEDVRQRILHLFEVGQDATLRQRLADEMAATQRVPQTPE